jgi:hypothetical protein
MASATYEGSALAIALLPASQRNRSKTYAAYSIEWNPIQAGAANINSPFTVDSSTDFVALTLTGNVTDTAAPPVSDNSPQLLLQLKAADKLMFDKPVSWISVVGTNFNPFPLPFPIWLSKASTMTGILTSLSNINKIVRLTFHGFILQKFDKTQSRGY